MHEARIVMSFRFSKQGAKGVTTVRFTVVYESCHRGALLLSVESEKLTSMVTQTLVIEGEGERGTAPARHGCCRLWTCRHSPQNVS